jgi:hypothetical protein
MVTQFEVFHIEIGINLLLLHATYPIQAISLHTITIIDDINPLNMEPLQLILLSVFLYWYQMSSISVTVKVKNFFAERMF